MQPIAEVLSSKRIEDSIGLRLFRSLMNEIRRCAQPRETVWAQISKAPRDAARVAMGFGFFRQPVVRSVLLKGMSREKCSPSARCRCFFLGIQPNRLTATSESGLPQALRSWFVSTGEAEKQFFPVVPFRCCDGARRGLKQQA